MDVLVLCEEPKGIVVNGDTGTCVAPGVNEVGGECKMEEDEGKSNGDEDEWWDTLEGGESEDEEGNEEGAMVPVDSDVLDDVFGGGTDVGEDGKVTNASVFCDDKVGE